MNDTHEHWTDQLSEYLDGGLDAEGREALEGHLQACPECRRVLEEIRSVVAAAEKLEDVEPSRDLWAGIAGAIGAPSPESAEPDVIHLPTARPRVRRRSGLFLTVPQLAAASLILALASAAATWWAGPGVASRADRATPAPPGAPAGAQVLPAADVASPPPELADELQVLEETLAAARDKLDPNTVRILEKNLGVIDRAIDESRRALALDPANVFLRDHLDRAYRDKLEYLRQAAGIAEWAG